MQKIGLSIIEAAHISGVGRTKLFEEIRQRRLNAKKVGRRTILLREDVEAWLKARQNSREISHG